MLRVAILFIYPSIKELRMRFDKDTYSKYVKSHAKPSPIVRNCIAAFCRAVLYVL